MSRKIPDTSVLAHDVESVMEETEISESDAKRLVENNFMCYSSYENPITFTQWKPDYRMRIQIEKNHYHLAFYELPSYTPFSEREITKITDILKNMDMPSPILFPSMSQPSKKGCSSTYSNRFFMTPKISLEKAIESYESLSKLDFLKRNREC